MGYQLKLDGYRAVAFRRMAGCICGPATTTTSARDTGPCRKGLTNLRRTRSSTARSWRSTPTAGRRSTCSRTTARPPRRSSYFVFDVMVLRGRNVMREPLVALDGHCSERRCCPSLRNRSGTWGPRRAAVGSRAVGRRRRASRDSWPSGRDSRYEPGLRSGAWQKMRVNRGQEFVIGGYTMGGNPFDALIFGYYEGDRLIYAARTRNGFTPATRAQLFKRFKGLETRGVPVRNLPEKKSGRWGAGLTAKKMAECRWLKPRTGRAVRVPGMDRRRPPSSHAIRRPA